MKRRRTARRPGLEPGEPDTRPIRTNQQVAERLGISEAAVRKAEKRALAKIREALETA